MEAIERLIIQVLLRFFTVDQLNAALRDPQAVAIIVGGLVSVATAVLGVYLLLRKMSMTSDAISHSILLGIVVAFLLMLHVFNMEPDLSSPWLIVGAAAAGVLTVVITEALHRSGLVKADAALGLVFPLLFAIAVIIISGALDRVHLDVDAVMVGEIGVAWANTRSHCFGACDDVVITPDDPRAQMGQRCVNCQPGGIGPRDPDAVFEETCFNCGTYTAAEAWRERLIDEPPTLVYWPVSFTAMGVITLVNLVFVALFYKELKLASFDPALAATLGLRPGLLHYLLMILVSVTAVGAFDAVGSILVVAFFVIPAAAAYLLTDRLTVMLILSPVIGIAGAVTGYELARGNFLGLINMNDALALLDRTIGLQGLTTWDSSISASMVIMTFFFFLVAWVASPRYGLVSTWVRRRARRQRFMAQLLLGHIYHHQGAADAASELDAGTLHEHLGWPREQTTRVMQRLRRLNLIRLEAERPEGRDRVYLTERGREQAVAFRARNLS